MTKQLDSFDMWMIRANIEHAKKEGTDTVVNRLLSQGYNAVAEAVRSAMGAQTHWHVASGLAGYGPDASDGNWSIAHSARDAAQIASEELGTWRDMAYESSRAMAESAEESYQRLANDPLGTEGIARSGLQWQSVADMFRDAWQETRRAEELDILARNLNAEHRANAPAYVNDPSALEESMRAIIDGYTDTAGTYHSGAPWNVSDSSRLYVWQCSETECLEEEEGNS